MKMMSYRYDKKQKNKKQKIIIFSVFVLVLIFTPLLNALYDIFESPIQQAYNNAEHGKKHFGILLDTARFSKKNLVEHNRFLQEQVQQLSLENERSVFFEQNFLRNSENDMFTNAYIIHRSFLGQSAIIINKGARDNMEIGDLVFMNNIILIGEISEVFDTTSRIILYTDSSMTQPGILFSQDLPINITGYGGLDYYFEIDRLVEVYEGDVVYSESSPGYLMAVVRDVDFDPRDPFKKVLLTPAVNIHSITHVQIKKKNTN